MLPNTTTTNSTSCQLPVSPATLSVSAVVPSGPMAQYSQINQVSSTFLAFVLPREITQLLVRNTFIDSPIRKPSLYTDGMCHHPFGIYNSHLISQTKISPESHPPYNITSDNMGAISWTVSVVRSNEPGDHISANQHAARWIQVFPDAF